MKKAILLLFAIGLVLPGWSQTEKELQEKMEADEAAKLLKSAPGDEGLCVQKGTSVSSEGYAIFGSPTSFHIAIDDDDIQAKNNTGASYTTLYQNYFGGNVSIGRGIDGNPSTTTIGSSTNDGSLNAFNTLYVEGSDDQVGIGTSTPTAKLQISVADFTTENSLAVNGWSLQELVRINGNADGSAWKLGVSGDMILRDGKAAFGIGTVTNDEYLGIGTATPTANITLLQSDAGITSAGGMEFNWSTGGWKLFYSGSHFSFVDRVGGDNDRRAYIEDNTGNYVQPSDLNKKANIELLAPIMTKVNLLKPCTYNYVGNETKTYGFIAQEVATVIPDLVRYDENNEPGLAYDHFGVIAIKAIQEQQTQIEALEEENQDLKQTLQTLLQRVEQLESR